MKTILLAMIFISLTAFSRAGEPSPLDSLKYVTDMPYICHMGSGPGCGDRIFWDAVRMKAAAIPALIEAIADTTLTEAVVPNLGGEWAVGDIAYSALHEIIHDIPAYELLGINFEDGGASRWSAFMYYLRESAKNRLRFREAVKRWYEENKAKLKWVESDHFQICDCSGPHPNGGHYEVGE